MASTLPQLLLEITTKYIDVPAQMIKLPDGSFRPRPYKDLSQEVYRFAAGLAKIGVARGDLVGLISENRPEWLVVDLAIQSLGAADVPRGNDTMPGELAFILGLTECSLVLVENTEQLLKVAGIRSELKTLKDIIVLDPDFSADEQRVKDAKLRRVTVHTYSEIVERGDGLLEKEPRFVEDEIEKGKGEDTATIIFTSGTTGEPKGVVLSQDNYIYEIGKIPDYVTVTPGDIWLCVLPVWHSYERVLQYVAVATASTLAYSKPIGRIMLADLETVRPQWMGSVPRIWEAVRDGIYRNVKQAGGIKLVLFRFFVAVGGAHARLTSMLRGLLPDFHRRNRAVDAAVAFLPWLLLWPLKALGNVLVFGKIKDKLGGKFVAGVSGGGALPPAIDTFFAAAGILLLEGYGLTETTPVLALRNQHRPVPGTVGKLLNGTECKILDEQGNELPAGQQGVIYVRGPEVMSGYYQRPEMTRAVLSEDGWLNTGDLGMLTHSGQLKLTGRAKDTVVLSGGENVEPLPIEQKITESEYIDTAVVVGQDQKFLGALVVPNQQAVEGYADENHIPYDQFPDLVEDSSVLELVESEINRLVSARNGFRGFERVYRFRVIPEPFTVGDELSAKQEVKRHVVADKYQRQIQDIFS
jgi:long-chain acyl-CoA synthetase